LWDLLPAGARLGGTTANFAIGCARLGHEAALLSCVGADLLGRDALKLLTEETSGLPFDISMIQTAPELPTGTVTVVVEPNGHPEYGISAPAAWDEITLQPEALELVKRSRTLCFGTLAQRKKVSRQTIRTLVEAVEPECLRVLDVNVRMPYFSEEALAWSLQHADVIKISEEELSLVINFMEPDAKHPLGEETLADEEVSARSVLKFAPSCRMVAITRGPHGSLLVTRDGTDTHPGFPVLVEDTVGAGDAFTAGMVHALLLGGSLSAVNTVANLCGSYVAGHAGATPPFSDELLHEVRTALHGEKLLQFPQHS
jgi:fructokinase